MREIEGTHSRQNANEAATETLRMVEAEQNDGSRYYDHRLTQIEKGKLLDSIEANQAVKPSSSTELSSTSSSGAASQSRPTNRGNTSDAPVFVGKDKRLLSILQTNPEEIAQAEARMREIEGTHSRQNANETATETLRTEKDAGDKEYQRLKDIVEKPKRI